MFLPTGKVEAQVKQVILAAPASRADKNGSIYQQNLEQQCSYLGLFPRYHPKFRIRNAKRTIRLLHTCRNMKRKESSPDLNITTMQWKNFLDSLSCLKASKVETHGVKNPYPTPTITLPAMLKPNHIANKAGKTNKNATFMGASNLLVLITYDIKDSKQIICLKIPITYLAHQNEL